jgi:hypothetical protein
MEQGSANSIMSYGVISRMYNSWDYIMERALEFLQNPDFQPVLQQKFDMLFQIGKSNTRPSRFII